MEKNDKVSETDLLMLQNSGMRLTLAQSALEKAGLASELAEAQHKNTIYQLYIKYGLSMQDKFDSGTGKITFAAVESVVSEVIEENKV